MIAAWRAEQKLAASDADRVGLESRWQAERELVDRILAIRADLRRGAAPVEGTGSDLERAAEAEKTARRPLRRSPRRPPCRRRHRPSRTRGRRCSPS